MRKPNTEPSRSRFDELMGKDDDPDSRKTTLSRSGLYICYKECFKVQHYN